MRYLNFGFGKLTHLFEVADKENECHLVLSTGQSFS